MTTENTETADTQAAAPPAPEAAAQPAEPAAAPAESTEAVPAEATAPPSVTAESAEAAAPAVQADAAPAGADQQPASPASGDSRPSAGPAQGGSFRDSRPGPRGGGRRGRGRYFSRRRVCSFCVDHVTTIDYKDVAPLRRYVSDMFKIEGRRKTGTCAKHQRALATAIKRARHIGLIPFSRTGALGQRFPG